MSRQARLPVIDASAIDRAIVAYLGRIERRDLRAYAAGYAHWGVSTPALAEVANDGLRRALGVSARDARRVREQIDALVWARGQL